jgi:hypothetical protein
MLAKESLRSSAQRKRVDPERKVGENRRAIRVVVMRSANQAIRQTESQGYVMPSVSNTRRPVTPVVCVTLSRKYTRFTCHSCFEIKGQDFDSTRLFVNSFQMVHHLPLPLRPALLVDPTYILQRLLKNVPIYAFTVTLLFRLKNKASLS